MLLGQVWQRMFEMPQIAVIMGCLIPIAAVIGRYWYMGHKARSENNLKRAMVERGMSIEEIERVLSAGSSRDDA